MSSLRFRHLKTIWYNIIITVITVMILVPVVFSLGPLLETKYFPVISKVNITSISDTTANDGMIELYGYVTKQRNCEFVNLNWYAGLPDRDFTRILSKRSPGSNNNINISIPTGIYHFGPWQITLGDDIKKYNYKIFAVIEHDCHPGWHSISLIGPIDLSKSALDVTKLSELTEH